MISRGFIKTSMIYTIAGSLPMASALILLPFYIAYLPSETYGALSISLAVSMLIQVIVTYSFDTSLYIHYHEFKNDREKLSSFISSAFLFMLLLGTGVAVFFSLAGSFLFDVIFTESTLSFFPYGFISIGIGIFQAIFKVHSNLLQTREKPEVFLWSNLVSFSIIAIATIIGLKMFPGTLIGPLGGRLLAGALTTLWVLARIFREFGVHFVSPWRNTSSRFNAFTFSYQLQQWGVNYLDRFLILFFLPLSSVGIYDFALKCVVPIELILNGLNASINPKVVSLISQQPVKGSTVEINRYFYGLVASIMLIVCMTIIAVPLALDWFVEKSDYGAAIQYIPFLALIYIFKSTRLYFVLPYAVLKKMERITVISLFINVLKVGLMAMLVQQYQLYGIVMSAFLAYSIETVLLWLNLKSHYSMRFNWLKLLGIPLSLFVVILFSELYLTSMNTIVLHLGYAIVCVGFLVGAYRNEIKILDPLKLVK